MKSMTGYGKGTASDELRSVTIELKSVNGRYLEVNTRFSKALSFLEDAVKKQIQERLVRGTIDVLYTYEHTGDSEKTVKLDLPLAREYVSAANKVRSELALENDITSMSIFRLPEVVVLSAKEEDSEAVIKLFVEATARAAAELDKMRSTEGATIKNDLKRLGGRISELLDIVKARAPQIVLEYSEKLRRRISELMGEVTVDEARLAMEIAVFADKCDVNEEISRLSSHLEQFKHTLELDEPLGRKLDFLSQEIHREINTIGSKANDLDLTNTVIAMKNELEKIKEQIRNVE